jgi:uncharacterized protein YggE
VDRPAEHRVEVTGTATARVDPDRAQWVLRVVDRDREAQVAFDRCAVRATAVAEALESELGEDARVTTHGVRVAPRWERDREGSPEATATVHVETPVARAGEAARAAMDAGADRVEGPHFVVSDLTERREALIGDAVEAARRKAERAARAAGRPLGRAIVIAEDEDHYAVAASADTRMLAGTGPEVRVDAREQSLSASVRVTFEFGDSPA